MDRIRAARLRRSFAWFKPCGPAMVAMVVRRLETVDPSLYALFPADLSPVSKKLFATLEQVVKGMDRFHALEPGLQELGAKAAGLGLRVDHYASFRDELLVVMADLGRDDWSDALSDDWQELLDAVSGAMLKGMILAKRNAA